MESVEMYSGDKNFSSIKKSPYARVRDGLIDLLVKISLRNDHPLPL